MNPDRIDSLTQREIEILRLLDARLSNEEIAAALHLPPEAVQRQTRSIYRKLTAQLLSSRVPEDESPP